MQKEVERLMRPSGLNLNWRWLAENRGIEVFSGLVVLRFKGQCSGELPTDESGVEDKSTALASSEVLRGHVLPFSEVRCDEVRKALLYLQPGANRIERQQALGLALGRVVAHELYHMLAQTTEHSRTGLSKPSQSLPELISPHEVDFRERDSRAIRNGFLR